MTLRLKKIFTLKRLLFLSFICLFMLYVKNAYIPTVKRHHPEHTNNVLPFQSYDIDKEPNLISDIQASIQKRKPGSQYNLTVMDAPDYSEGRTQILLKYIRKSPGFFVDYRGGNGEDRSISLQLEKHHGWNGTVIEPDISLFAELKKKRRNCYILNACIDSNNKTEGDVGVHATENEMWEIPCYRLDDIFLAMDQNRVDLLLLDSKNSELNILKSISFALMRTQVILVTFHAISDMEVVKGVTSFLASKNYSAVHQISNSYLGLTEIIFTHRVQFSAMYRI